MQIEITFSKVKVGQWFTLRGSIKGLMVGGKKIPPSIGNANAEMSTGFRYIPDSTPVLVESD